MGHGHMSSGAEPAVHVRRWSRIAVLGLIVLSGVLALVGVVHWWPDGDRVDRLQGLIPFAAPGYVLVHGELTDVRAVCTEAGPASATCGDSRVRVLDGSSAGETVPLALSPDVLRTGLRAGDRVLLFDATAVQDPAGAAAAFSFYRADRGGSMLWLAVLFALAVVAVALRRGLMALLSLAFAAAVVLGFLVPALLSGRPAIPLVVVSSVLILIVMLYLTHGPSMRTSVALVGALIGVALSTLFGWLGIVGTRLGGLGDDSAGLLGNNVTWIDVQQLVIASVVLAGLGTLNDVTVTQASALWELRSASSTMSRWELFRSAMRIGRDHVASTVYTLVFAYLGTALVLLVAVQLYGGGAADFVTAEDVAEEVVRTLVGGVALVLAMPITTALGALVVADARVESPRVPIEPSPRYLRSSTPGAARPQIAVDRYRRLPGPWQEE